MPTLKDVLVVLRELDVGIEEVAVPTFMYSYLVGEAERVASMEASDGDDDEQDDEENEGHH